MARPSKNLSLPEFVGLVALLIAAVAFAIDAMLPALPNIAADLSPLDPNKAQLVLSFFLFGMGLGTLVAGPLSDSYGRKSVITYGMVIYIVGAILASMATSMEMLFLARMIQGLGAAAPRVVAQALIRDLYDGRRMAQISSFVMMIFIFVPSMAPSIGALILSVYGWRGIFGGFVVFALICILWLNLRQPETLRPENRRSMKPAKLWEATVEVVSNRLVLAYIAVLTLGFGQMFALLSSIQQIYEVTYDKAESFPFWFLIGGLMSGLATVFNAALVMRLGMRRIAIFAFGAQVVISGGLLVLTQLHVIGAVMPFGVFFLWQVSVFAMAGLVFGNLNALALEPLGHIAGIASSVITAASTILSIAIAAPIGLAFRGTPNPLLIGTLIFSTVAFVLMRSARAMDPTPKTKPPPV
ncbi:multidrug effflux MFS transporter [Flavimaricola marinus]|uniref:Bicyclomycin resistance protein n=1 Tax=Flavimaricola marinus TaxID=1819565 RepID=A0A238LCZ0_9RHOB|nr:multidrug effflux MFS transporter [Flavimaricola marinus]SMY07452.1 Bicyclomycin resistance protein [Flavimaricola marinus]